MIDEIMEQREKALPLTVKGLQKEGMRKLTLSPKRSGYPGNAQRYPGSIQGLLVSQTGVDTVNWGRGTLIAVVALFFDYFVLN